MNEKKYKRMSDKILSLVHEHQKIGSLITTKELSEKTKLTQKDVISIAEDLGLNINVGFSNHFGIGSLKKSNYTFEDLNLPYENE